MQKALKFEYNFVDMYSTIDADLILQNEHFQPFSEIKSQPFNESEQLNRL